MTSSPNWQLSTTGDAVIAWPSDLPGIAKVEAFSIVLDADTLTEMLHTLRTEQLGATSTGDL